MAKKGALKSTLIVTSDELKVNGGRWLLQSGPAIRVRGFNSSSIGDRKIIGGDALPVYVLSESDARANGGQFLLKGGQPIQVTDVIGSARGVIQGKAIPVWPVDDNGDYDPTFVGYSGKVIATGPIAYWILGEAAGAIAVDQINSPAQDGTYTGVVLGQPGIGDGNTAPLFDGTNDVVDIYSVTFNGVFNGSAGTMMAWARVSSAAVWTDGATRYILKIAVDAGNRIWMQKIPSNELRWLHTAGAGGNQIRDVAVTPADWFVVALTWNQPSNEVIAYFQGIQQGAALAGLGVWAGALDPTQCVVGAEDTAPTDVWDGFEGHIIVWDRVLSPATILDLASV